MPVMRDGVLPIVDAMSGGSPAPQADYAVVVRGSTRSLAVTVTTLFGRRELVATTSRPRSPRTPPCRGAAVMSDGQIALIVDCDALEPCPRPRPA